MCVWFFLYYMMQKVIWRVKLPEYTRNNLVSQDNPKGQIAKPDLELVAEVLEIGFIVEPPPLT